ncbi:MAG TPA: rhomboid family intramembrane serine protease [Flavobacteriales bacterium]
MGIRDDIQAQWRMGGAVKRLLFVNIAVFLTILALSLVGLLTGHPQLEGRVLEQLMASSDGHWLIRHPWTVITYMFTHQGVMHLVWNMIMFWFSGQLFRNLLGDERLVGNYLLGGLSGLALYLISGILPVGSGLGAHNPILGASAAVMAVFIGIATYQPELRVGLLFIGPVALKWIALGVLVLDLIGIRDGSNTGGHLAHIGGALYGFIAAKQLMRGNDWSLAFVQGLQRIGGLFRRNGRKGRMRVVERPRRKARVMQDTDFNALKKAKQERVDAILDKISRSGYDSLSKDERDLLFRASNDQ